MKKLLLFSFVFLLFAGCKKQYPDDKWRHTNGPTKRLTKHSWRFVSHEFLVPNSFEFGSQFTDGYVKFKDGGVCWSETQDGLPNDMIYLYDFTGTWELVEDDNKIKITYKINPSYSKLWTIQRMDRNSLVLYCDSIKYSFTKF